MSLNDLPEERQLNILRSIVLCDVEKKESLREEVERLQKKLKLYEEIFKSEMCCDICSERKIPIAVIYRSKHMCKINEISYFIYKCDDCIDTEYKCHSCYATPEILEEFELKK